MLPFEDPDPTLVPLAARRALDRAGQRLSLRGWQSLSFVVRASIATLGEHAEVDVERVRELVAGAHPPAEEMAPIDDPSALAAPAEVIDALGGARPLTAEAWQRLDALGRYVLASYARRGRTEKLAIAYDALVARS